MENNHYFSENNDDLVSEPKFIDVLFSEQKFKFKTDNGVFSKDYLDYASSILLKNVILKPTGNILDVGCGYGPIGIILSKLNNRKVTMIDINNRAISLSKENVSFNSVDCDVIKSDCLDSVKDNKFSTIITNPPIRAGKSVIYQIYRESFDCLEQGGELWIVIQHKHGAPSSIKELNSIFGNCDTVYKKKGFYILKATK